MAPEYPFKAEYAKSGRASCKGCKEGIGQGVLRLAIMVQSPFFDGRQANWYHQKCFFKKQKPKHHTVIEGFANLRWDDQEKIKESIGDTGVPEPQASTIKKGKAKSKTKEVKTDSNGMVVAFLTEFHVEYSKSSRALCRVCDNPIIKKEVRMSKKEADARYGMLDAWHHVECFAENLDELGFTYNIADVDGFTALTEDDRNKLLSVLPSTNKVVVGSKRKPTVEKDIPIVKKPKPALSAMDKKLKEQSSLLWGIKDALQAALSGPQMKSLLAHNSQYVPVTGQAADACVDMLAFGPLEPCGQCTTDGLVSLLDGADGYKCHGQISEWTKCFYRTQSPARRSNFSIPKGLRFCEYLKDFKFKKRERLFPVGVGLTTNEAPVRSSSSVPAPETGKPLRGCAISILGKLTKTKATVKQSVENLGGRLQDKIDGSLVGILSSEAELEKMSRKMKAAKEFEVNIISIDFLEAVEKKEDAETVANLVEKHTISEWKSDPTSKIKKVEVKSLLKKQKSREEKMFKSSVKSLKVTVKGGAAVDPESGLEDNGQVLKDMNGLHTAVLGKVDLVQGQNSYYKLQVIEKERGGPKWNVFRSWGRVGTTIGGSRVDTFGSKLEAKQFFQEHYLEKSGNNWADRDNFVKKPRCFFPLDIDYSTQEDDNESSARLRDSGSESKLAKPIQDIVKMIFDIETMKKTLVEFEIDLEKMPLGKLSKKHIEGAYVVLTELQGILTDDNPGGRQVKLIDASNRFYTLIPHSFGLEQIPLLDTEESIKEKTAMLDNLLEMEVAYSLLKGTKVEAGTDPMDAHYNKLKCEMGVVDKESETFSMIKEFITNTHAKTHSGYTLELLDAFEIQRQGEAQRFKPFKDLPNRKLLWHGSRVTNYAGILSQGLRIAPPEAPSTGYMFGKGIYFADMVSKSANYCSTSPSANTALMLLCDVALGNMMEKTQAHYVDKLPKGKHSMKGCGRTCPDPKQDRVIDGGVVVPMGTSFNTGTTNSSLLYNEYIVYDVGQVSMKYLLKLKFNYKNLYGF